MIGILPSFFSFYSSNDLIRLGNDKDGGYLVSESDLEKSEVLVSLGINDDWSFEEHFYKKKKVAIEAYDESIDQRFFLIQVAKSLLRFDNPNIIWHWIKTSYKFKKFFSKQNINHTKQNVGINSFREDFCSLLEVFKKIKSENIFLKIDIEGEEYRVLDDLVMKQDRITGVVMEMHDIDMHFEKIENFIKNFNLKLVHIHANNAAPLRTEDNLPVTLELTFSKYSKVNSSTILPNELDKPCDPNIEEIYLKIRD